ncbi:MAG: nucleoside 2-deoxyribosyltransferase [Opitutales bacterium]|nr:nucleoside 2-deoxyribosyltransferase [Opitutales bacterium]
MTPEPKQFYFAGELFDAKHLTGNAHLAAAIEENSGGKYQAMIPQEIELRSDHPHDIRDADILALLNSDLALFHFDGVELDSGTVVEYMFAKFADIPSVILRSDFRKSGDQSEHPWNLMVSFYPRTEVVLKNAIVDYKTAEIDAASTHSKNAIARAEALNQVIAKEIIAAFDRVLKTPPTLKPESIEPVFEWLKKMPSFRHSEEEINTILDPIIERKKSLS